MEVDLLTKRGAGQLDLENGVPPLALLDQVRTWAIESNYPAITLITFSEVPWNRPLYEHLGFVVLSEQEFGPDLQTVRQDETNSGLDPASRVWTLVSTTVRMVGES